VGVRIRVPVTKQGGGDGAVVVVVVEAIVVVVVEAVVVVVVEAVVVVVVEAVVVVVVGCSGGGRLLVEATPSPQLIPPPNPPPNPPLDASYHLRPSGDHRILDSGVDPYPTATHVPFP
jgi:hypothetical protein